MKVASNSIVGRLMLSLLLFASFESCGDSEREYLRESDDGEGGAPDEAAGGSAAGANAPQAGAPSSGGNDSSSEYEEGGSGGEVDAAGGAGGQPQAPGRCTLSKPFDVPTFVPAFADTNISAATLAADGLMIFFWRDSALYSATRPDVDSQFGAPSEDELLAPASDWFKKSQSLNDVPAISSDSLSLYSQFGGQTVYHIWTATRESISEPFGAPVQVESLADTIRFSPFISHDGRTLYFRQDNHLYFARKTTSGFGTAEPMTSLNSPNLEDQPVLSPDELTIFFYSTRTDGSAKGDGDIWFSTRKDVEDPFDAPKAVDELNTPAFEQPLWLSEDGCEIWLSRMIDNPAGARLMMARRPL